MTVAPTSHRTTGSLGLMAGRRRGAGHRYEAVEWAELGWT
jgi:hypothetical protein